MHRDALSGTPLAEHPNFTLHQADVLDGEAMKELSAGATHIVHCAAIAGVDTVLESPVRTMRVNVIGTYNLLEAAVGTLDSLERFIYFSTSEVFGTHAFRVEETQVSSIGSVGEARWTYAVSKLAGEHLAHAYHDELGLPAVIVHPFNVFGPGRSAAARSAPSSRTRSRGEISSSTATARRSAPGATSTTWSRARSRASSTRARPARRSTSATRATRSRSTTWRSGSAGSPAPTSRSPSSRSTTQTSSCGSRTSRRHARCSASRRRSTSTRASRRRSRGIARSLTRSA